MTPQQMYKSTNMLLFIVPVLLISWKLSQGYIYSMPWLPDTYFDVAFDFTIEGDDKVAATFVKCYLPESNAHQQISNASIKTGPFEFKKKAKEEGARGIWRGDSQQANTLGYNFQYKGTPIRFKLEDQMPLVSNIPDEILPYLDPEEHIQSDHRLIQQLAHELAADQKDLNSLVRSLYDFVYDMESVKTSKLTGALTALRKNGASCNGKSRLLVALSRAAGIPARVVGGMILEQTQKRTSHLWTELWIGGQWVTFDALNGHYAYLPGHYMQLYYGDHFLITRTPKVKFDYLFTIQKKTVLASKDSSAFTLWPLINNSLFSFPFLKSLILLPLCALIIGIFRNVIGIKTIGVFLPAIVAVSLGGVNPIIGLAAFAMVVAIVALLHFPLEKWGILHTPKMIIMLTSVVLCLLSAAMLGQYLSWDTFTNIALFPIIVLTIAAEKFARTIVEDGFLEALRLQAQTLLLAALCYVVFLPDFTLALFLTFPEMYAVLLGLLLLLGRWIGLRLSEYIRFQQVVKSNPQA